MTKIEVKNVNPGKTVTYHGKPCLVLEHREDGTLLLHLDQVTRSFGKTNNYAESDLRVYLECDWLDELTENNSDEVIDRTVDLTALNGSTEYGSVVCKAALLTLDELRRYHDILPRSERFEWSATPWSTPNVDEDDEWVLGLSTNGNINSDYCTGTRGARPAFLIPSSLCVEMEDEPVPDALRACSTEELLAEVRRRMG